MHNFRWIGIVAALLVAAGIGVMAYNAGVAHGIAVSGKLVVPPPAAPYPYPYPYYGWHPFGFGFFFAPLFFLILFFVVARALLGRRHWHHRGGCRYGEHERSEEAARP